MKKLIDIIKESKAWERKFGEPLPTLKSVQERHNAKNRSLKEDSPTYKESLHDAYEKIDKVDRPAFWEYLEELVEKEHGTVADFIYDFLIERD